MPAFGTVLGGQGATRVLALVGALGGTVTVSPGAPPPGGGGPGGGAWRVADASALVVDIALYDDHTGDPVSGATVRVWLDAPDGAPRAGGAAGLPAIEDVREHGHYRARLALGLCPTGQLTAVRAVAQGGTAQQRTLHALVLPVSNA